VESRQNNAFNEGLVERASRARSMASVGALFACNTDAASALSGAGPRAHRLHAEGAIAPAERQAAVGPRLWREVRCRTSSCFRLKGRLTVLGGGPGGQQGRGSQLRFATRTIC